MRCIPKQKKIKEKKRKKDKGARTLPFSELRVRGMHDSKDEHKN